MLEVNEREEGVVALHLPIGCLKTRSGLEPGANSVPTNPLADEITTAPSGRVGC